MQDALVSLRLAGLRSRPVAFLTCPNLPSIWSRVPISLLLGRLASAVKLSLVSSQGLADKADVQRLQRGAVEPFAVDAVQVHGLRIVAAALLVIPFGHRKQSKYAL